jgi:hypothetical protein
MRGQTTADKQDAHEEKMADSGGYSSMPGHTTKFVDQSAADKAS